MLQGKVLVAQGGGPTAVINQSLVGTITESRKFSAVSNVYGSLHGISGIVNEDFLDLTQETTTNLYFWVASQNIPNLSTKRMKKSMYLTFEIQ